MVYHEHVNVDYGGLQGERGNRSPHVPLSQSMLHKALLSAYYSGMVMDELRCLPLRVRLKGFPLLCYALFSKPYISSGGVGGSPSLHPTYYVDCTTNNTQKQCSFLFQHSAWNGVCDFGLPLSLSLFFSQCLTLPLSGL